MGLYARKSGRRYFEVTDFIAPVIPVGLGFGRLGNFINAELPGRVADVPWAVVYPGDFVARHPSSLYQSLVEGPVLFAVLFIFARMPRPVMATSGVFLIGYGCLRVFSEFFRMPDAHLNFVALGWVTMGQILSLPMIAAGVVLVVLAYRLGLVARARGAQRLRLRIGRPVSPAHRNTQRARRSKRANRAEATSVWSLESQTDKMD
jgi:phosphatidylglycerol:prolipoprotein diacylglycerol transferase